MNAALLARSVDAIASRDGEPVRGYADTQRPGSHQPAIDLPRAAWHAWLGHLMARMRRPLVVHVAAHPLPAVAASMRELGAQVRELGLQAPPAAICDVLLLDADEPVVVAELWAQHAHRVRAGGLVAIVDRSQDELGPLVDTGMGPWLLRLEAELLVPHGQRWLRHGDAACIHSYSQTIDTQMACLPDAADGLRDMAPQALGGHDGFAFWKAAHRCFAVPAAGPAFSLRNLHGNRFDMVLVAEDLPQLQARVVSWNAVQPRLAMARDLLGDDAALAARLVGEVVAAHEDLSATLVAAVEVAPWCRELLLACGIVQLFGAEPRLGGALLRRVAGMGLDASVVACAGAAFVTVLHDEAGARSLLDSVRETVRLRKCAALCRELPRGHVLWLYADQLVKVRGVLEVGLARDAHAPIWRQLGVSAQCYVDGDPRKPAAVNATDTADSEHVVRIGQALAASSGPLTLWRESGAGRASWRRPLAGGAVESQVEALPLDQLVANGAIDPARYNLLVVDAAGSELDILQGAKAVLAHCEFLCVTLWPEARHDGAPLPQDVQGFLRNVLGGEDGFGLAAYEPATDGVHGTALFWRNNLSGGPW